MKHNNLKLLALMWALLLPVCVNAEPVTLPPSQGAADAQVDPESVAAVVNGHQIKVKDIDQQIKQKPNFAIYLKNAEKSPKLMNDLRRRVAVAMVNREVLIQAASKSDAIKEDEVNKAVEEVISGYGGKEKLSELLQGIGTDYNTFRAEISKDFRINQYLENTVAKDVKVSEDEIAAEFKSHPERYAEKPSVRASHILVKADGNSSKEEAEKAEQKIKELHTAAVKPEADFAKLAQENSQCPSSAQGGDLGFFTQGMMVPEFEQAAFSMKPGQISQPIKTQFGWHIIKLSEQKSGGQPDLKSAHDKVAEDLKNRKREEAIQGRLAELKKTYQAEVKI